MLWRLAVYYGLLTGVALLVARWLPAARSAASLSRFGELTGAASAVPGGPLGRPGAALATAVAMIGALALIVPVAWLYMRTKPRARYDASLVHTVIVLPVAVAGIVLIVQDSLALAFSLAGIVAAVRFRNTLRDTKDAVYIFLAIGVGLAAGVQAFTVAFVMSVVYVLVVLVLWRFDVGAMPDAVPGLVAATGGAAISRDFPIRRPSGRQAPGAAAVRDGAALHWDIPDGELVRQLVAAPPAPGLTVGGPRTTRWRDVYFDTPEGTLRSLAARCRVRFDAAGGQRLTIELPEGGRLEEPVRGADFAAPFTGNGSGMRRLRALADPARLGPWLTLEVERTARTLRLPAVPLPWCDVVVETVTARLGERSAQLHDVALRPRRWGRAGAARIARELELRFALRPTGGDRLSRAEAALADAEGRALAQELRGERELALLAVQHGRLGLERVAGQLRLPVHRGGGEAACRAALRQLTGSGEGQLRLLGMVPAAGDRPPLEVWTVRQMHRAPGGDAALQWFTPADVLSRVGSPVLRDPRTLGALTVAARSPLLPEWSGAAFASTESTAPSSPTSGTSPTSPTSPGSPASPASPTSTDPADPIAHASRVTLSELRTPVLTDEARDAARAAPEQFLNAELSWVEFNARVLALAEDPGTPAAARLRFLAIFSSNLDQFVMTQLGALKQLVALQRGGPAADGLSPQETLDAVAVRLRPLLGRQARAFQALARDELAPRGVAIVSWHDLEAPARDALRARWTDDVLPFLTPKALTRAPGHPFPLVGDRRIALLVALRDAKGSPAHYAQLEVPDTVPRFLPVGDGRRFLPIEELLRGNLDLVYPGREVIGAYAFRLTRSGDLQLDESSTANFLQAIEEELARRHERPVVRIELEPGTPQPLQDLLQRELRFEESERDSALGPADVYRAEGLLDPGGLHEIAERSLALADYPPLTARDRFPGPRTLFEQLDERDVLVHHPYDSFTASFERFITEAAADPTVAAIKLVLYRPGGPSAVADALREAAARGKDVSVIVEVKARFDEARNIEWARGLEHDGIHVVTGLVSLKTHAKLALVVRRSPGGSVRRYAHVGTGNYNPDTARLYTDVGLFTADPRITTDVHALFNELTGSSQTPRPRLRHLLVAPTTLLDGLLALIEREAAHARAGQPGRIRAKLNGLADATVIQALYRASQSGVDVDLVVRGICTLRPGVPGLSERIRVTSLLGRFLEHARIYHFGNGGADEYYLASADWRPRNLRRRVEVAAPVYDAAARARLDHILATELADPGGWVLSADGSYERTAAAGGDGSSAQTRFLHESAHGTTVRPPEATPAS
jgi:polyphosphate kinase